MLLTELFAKNNVSFPEWLPDEDINDEWENAIYLKGENVHKWELNSIMGFTSITLEDNEVYNYTAYDRDNNVVLEKIVTPEYEMIT